MPQTAVCLQHGRPGFDPWIGKFPWRRKWQPIQELDTPEATEHEHRNTEVKMGEK